MSSGSAINLNVFWLSHTRLLPVDNKKADLFVEVNLDVRRNVLVKFSKDYKSTDPRKTAVLTYPKKGSRCYWVSMKKLISAALLGLKYETDIVKNSLYDNLEQYYLYVLLEFLVYRELARLPVTKGNCL